MSLDIYLKRREPVVVFEENITHNLGLMAKEVKVSNGWTLYQMMWHPDEIGVTKAEQLIEPLREAHTIMIRDQARLEQFNPANGWGNYENLHDTVQQYLNACIRHPDAVVEVSR